MPRFRYALQPALDAAVAREREAHGLVSALKRALALERSALEVAEADAAATRAALAGGLISQAGVCAVVGRRLEALATAACASRERITVAARAVAQARDALAIAAQRRSALERHRSRKRSAHETLAELREAAELDEANALSAGRRFVRR